jgi:selenocysteine lyase/cysteine desulfurase
VGHEQDMSTGPSDQLRKARAEFPLLEDRVCLNAAAVASCHAFARIIGATSEDVALIRSVSAAAGLVAAQFVEALGDENLRIGAQEYSSNHFPWRQLAGRGHEVRQKR